MKTRIIFAILCSFVSVPTVAEIEITKFNWQIDHKTTTEFPDCEEYVDGIIKMCELIIKVEDDSQRKFFMEIAQDFKKSLKKCERKCKKKTTGVTVGGEHQLK